MADYSYHLETHPFLGTVAIFRLVQLHFSLFYTIVCMFSRYLIMFHKFPRKKYQNLKKWLILVQLPKKSVGWSEFTLRWYLISYLLLTQMLSLCKSDDPRNKKINQSLPLSLTVREKDKIKRTGRRAQQGIWVRDYCDGICQGVGNDCA